MKQKPTQGTHFMLKDWQDLHFTDKEPPSNEDRTLWLARHNSYNKFNKQVLLTWDETRFKREYLDEKQIADWLVFYFD